MADWVTVAEFREPSHAHFYASVLRSRGIEVFLRDEHTAAANPILGATIVPIKLIVPAHQTKSAQSVINKDIESTTADIEDLQAESERESEGEPAADHPEASRDKGVCPRCGCPFIRVGWFRRAPTVILLLVIALSINLLPIASELAAIPVLVALATGFIRRIWVCENCGHKWRDW